MTPSGIGFLAYVNFSMQPVLQRGFENFPAS
jgi:hypothetical protein